MSNALDYNMIKKHTLLDHFKWPFNYLFGPMPQDKEAISLVKSIKPNEYDTCIVFVGDLLGLGHKTPVLSNQLKQHINDADLLVGNLECSISSRKSINLYHQTCDAQVLKDLKYQISPPQILLSLANNHAAVENLEKTIQSLEKQDFHIFGTKEKKIFEFKNILLLAATQWLPRKNEQLIANFEDCARFFNTERDKKIITYLHYGEEFKLQSALPLTLPQNTILHVGHHPHVPHIPKLKTIPHFTSLGNFWTSFGGRKVQYGIVLKVYLENEMMVGHDWRFIKSWATSREVSVDFCDKVEYFL